MQEVAARRVQRHFDEALIRHTLVIVTSPGPGVFRRAITTIDILGPTGREALGRERLAVPTENLKDVRHDLIDVRVTKMRCGVASVAIDDDPADVSAVVDFSIAAFPGQGHVGGQHRRRHGRPGDRAFGQPEQRLNLADSAGCLLAVRPGGLFSDSRGRTPCRDRWGRAAAPQAKTRRNQKRNDGRKDDAARSPHRSLLTPVSTRRWSDAAASRRFLRPF